MRKNLNEVEDRDIKRAVSEKALRKLQHDVTMIGSSLEGLAHLMQKEDQEDPSWDVAQLILGIKQNVYSIADRIEVKLINNSEVINGKS